MLNMAKYRLDDQNKQENETTPQHITSKKNNASLQCRRTQHTSFTIDHKPLRFPELVECRCVHCRLDNVCLFSVALSVALSCIFFLPRLIYRQTEQQPHFLLYMCSFTYRAPYWLIQVGASWSTASLLHQRSESTCSCTWEDCCLQGRHRPAFESNKKRY